MLTSATLGTCGFLPCQVKLFSGHKKKLFVKHMESSKYFYCITLVKSSIKGSETQAEPILWNKEKKSHNRRAFVISIAQLLLLSLIKPGKTLAEEQNFAEIWTKRVFPKAGYNSPEALTSESVQLDTDAMKDPQVKKGIENLKAYRSKVLDMCSAFQQNPQMEIQQLVRDNFNVAQLRDDLNKANRVFNEETQITTDRFVRNILQDVNELESVSGLLDDKTRTRRKIENTRKWLKKLYHDFDRFLALYP
ncbi:hypothetical protein GpartN1_g1718.t1 [Galdieria partita]|uniref:Uncharacterized protein n=1 Tax=Galdieria partita TaxID=83374 RepID=A0A9C7PUN4_9RHOD|nr:hypothetical protein GpartN1_g1718.t1 [Galdieria partita]